MSSIRGISPDSHAGRYEGSRMVLRTLEMLWAAHPEPITPNHLMAEFGISRTTALRILSLLVREGWSQVDGWLYRALPRESMRSICRD